MARRDLEDSLERLAALRADPEAQDAAATLREILASRSSHALGRAAEVAAELHLHELVPELVAAFDRMMEDPIRRDPACRGKTGLVEALQLLDAAEADVYRRAIRHVQLEPVFGGKQDTAPELRGAAARGLVRMNHPDALLLLAELLADPEPAARRAAARAVAYHGGLGSLPLLRLKALTGDADPDVVGDCLLALLQISPDDSLSFVERFLQGEWAEIALFALGESRAPGALPRLQRFFEGTADPDLSRSALVAIAMLRSDEAIEWLLARIAGEPGPIARQAVEAFGIHRTDERLVARVRDCVDARQDVDLHACFAEHLA